MTKGYSEIPENWAAIAPYINQGNMIQSVLSAKKCFFYDTCSFRYHANMQQEALDKLLQYILRQNGIIIITTPAIIKVMDWESTLSSILIPICTVLILLEPVTRSGHIYIFHALIKV